MECSSCGGKLQMMQKGYANCPHCGQNYLIDKAGLVKVDITIDYGDNKKTQNVLKGIVVSLAIGLSLTISGLVMQYMPRGNDSMVSAGNVGATVGEGDEWIDISGMGTGNVQAEYVIRISGHTIYVNGQAFETVESFEEILKTMDRTKNVTLVDDFAVSATYLCFLYCYIHVLLLF